MANYATTWATNRRLTCCHSPLGAKGMKNGDKASATRHKRRRDECDARGASRLARRSPAGSERQTNAGAHSAAVSGTSVRAGNAPHATGSGGRYSGRPSSFRAQLVRSSNLPLYFFAVCMERYIRSPFLNRASNGRGPAAGAHATGREPGGAECRHRCYCR